jgi:hypothetical protein
MYEARLRGYDQARAAKERKGDETESALTLVTGLAPPASRIKARHVPGRVYLQA